MAAGAVLVLAAWAVPAAGAPYFVKTRGQSTATITHTPQAGHATTNTVTVNVLSSDPVFATTTSASKAQYQTRTITDGSASTTGFAGIGYQQSSTSASAIFSGGTGVGQTDPTDLLGASIVNLDFNMHFKISSTALVNSIASASLVLAGSVGPLDGSVALDSLFRYYRVNSPTDAAGSGDLLATVSSLTYSQTNTNPAEVPINGVGYVALADAVSLSGSVPVNQFLRIAGYVQFRANNAAGPSQSGFSPEFSLNFDTIGQTNQRYFVPSNSVGTFHNPNDWGGQLPDGDSMLFMFADPEFPSTRIAIASRDMTARRMDLRGGEGLDGVPGMVVEVRGESTLEVREGITMDSGSEILLRGGSRLISGRSLIDGRILADGAKVMATGDMAITGRLSSPYTYPIDYGAQQSSPILAKDGPGNMVVFGDNYDLFGLIEIDQGGFQLEQPRSGGYASFLIMPEGMLAANYDFTDPDHELIGRIEPGSAGVLAGVSVDLRGPLNLAEHPLLSLGATRMATIHGLITPGIDPNTQRPTYRLGGGGGVLDVVSNLADRGTPTDLVLGGQDTKVILRGNNTFSGALVVQRGATLGVGSPGALGSRQVDVNYDGLVYEDPALDSTNIDATVRLTGTAQTTGRAQIGWNGDKTIDDLAQVGRIVGTGQPAETRILGLGASGDSGVLTLGVDISDADAGLAVLGAESAQIENASLHLRLVLGGESTVDLRGRRNTHTGGTHVLAGRVLADHPANLGAPGTLTELEPGSALVVPAAREGDFRDLVKQGRAAGGWRGTAGISSAAAAGQPAKGAVGHAPGPDSGSMTIMFTILGDTDLDQNVLPDDYAAAKGRFTGPGGSGQTWHHGDGDYDDDVDNSDLARILAFMNLSFDEPTRPEPGSALLVYDPDTGDLTLDASGAPNGLITNFVLQSQGRFRPAHFVAPGGADCATSLCTAQSDEISWSDLDGFGGVHDLGAVAPPGLSSMSELAQLFTRATFVGDPGTGMRHLRLIPEPSALVMLLGLGAVLVRRR